MAFNVGVSGWLLCGFFNFLIYWTVWKDERDVQERIARDLRGEEEEEEEDKTSGDGIASRKTAVRSSSPADVLSKRSIV